MELSHIEAISFDGDMTLWDFEMVMRRSLAYTLAELHMRAPGDRSQRLTIDKLIEIRDVVAAEQQGKSYNLDEIRRFAFERTVEVIGSTDPCLAQDRYGLYMKHRFEDIELYPDVIPTKEALQADYRLGLLSNGNSDPERCGLPNRFMFVTFAQYVGVEKPAPAIFLAACEQADCNPGQLMHVGDCLETDVVGARRVGAVPIWLNREERRNNTDITPDFEIHTLADLTAILLQDEE